MKRSRVLALCSVLATAAVAYGVLTLQPGGAVVAHAQATNSAEQSQRLAYEQNTVDIVRKYGNSVVAVDVTVKGKRVNPLENVPPEFRQFFKQLMPPGASQPHQLIERAAGSGFVVDKEHQIITNYHVVRAALAGNRAKFASGAKVTVKFPGSKKSLPVKVIGVDQSYDLALLQVVNSKDVPSNVKPIPLGDSDKVEVGQKAIAIGNPFGLQSTVTQGIVSAINRRQEALVSGVPISYIQTDAAINPGNSGGPLISSAGKVIGINDEILAPNGTFIGVGFAIPSNLLREHLDQLKQGGFIKKAQMGVTVMSLSDYPATVRDSLNLPDYGVMIVQVAPGGPADKAGLKGAQFSAAVGGQQWPAGGDVILQVDGHKLQDANQLQSLVFSEKAGQTVTLEVLRKGKKRTIKVRLEVLTHKQDSSLMQQH